MYNPRFICTCLGAVCSTTTKIRVPVCAPTGVGAMTWLKYFAEGYSYRNAHPITLALKTLNILQNHYPEQLGLAVCYHPPRLFQLTWRVSSGPLCLLSPACTKNAPCVCVLGFCSYPCWCRVQACVATSACTMQWQWLLFAMGDFGGCDSCSAALPLCSTHLHGMLPCHDSTFVDVAASELQPLKAVFVLPRQPSLSSTQ